MTTKGPEQRCRTCLQKNTGHKDTGGDAVPAPGDFTICYYCATVSRFDKDMNLIPLTDEDMGYLQKHPDVLTTLQKASFLIKQRTAQN